MEFSWYQNGKDVIYWHWSPEYNWEMNFPLEGYNEALIVYVLAASSPTFLTSPHNQAPFQKPCRYPRQGFFCPPPSCGEIGTE